MARRILQVFEHSNLYYSPEGPFLESDYKALLQLNDTHEQQYFTPGRNFIRFHQYVGVIQIGDLTLEILPKVDCPAVDSGNDEAKWQYALLHMLKECRWINLDETSYASLKCKHFTLFDLYLWQFLKQVDALIHQGLVKKYRKQEGNLSTLKGQLQFSQHISQNLIHKERFYSKYQVYDRNHLLHSILYAALEITKALSYHPSINQATARVLSNFPEVDPVKITAKHFEQIKFDRKTQGYTEAITLAKMIILNYSPDLKGGDQHMLSMLFDMNLLFEEFVYSQLRKGQTHYPELQVEAQVPKRFWRSRNIRPDILLILNKKRYVLDTKWKLNLDGQPSDEDLKQIYVYNHYYQADQGILLYPYAGQEDTTNGYYELSEREENRFSLTSADLCCKVGYINLFTDSKDNWQTKSSAQITASILELLV